MENKAFKSYFDSARKVFTIVTKMPKTHSSIPSSIKKYIHKYSPKSQQQLRCAIRADIEYDNQEHEDVIIALTNHYLKAFDIRTESRYGKKGRSQNRVVQIFDHHIFTINEVAYFSPEYVKITIDVASKFGKVSIVELKIRSSDNTQFVQFLYRNIQLASLRDTVFRSNDESVFPLIDLNFSPSQLFQFQYFAYCSYHGIKYDQFFVRYIHTLFSEISPIIDLSMINRKYFNNLYSLKCSDNFFVGLALKNFSFPDIFKQFHPLMSNVNLNLKILSFVNCDCTKHLTYLADSVKQTKSKKRSFCTEYWNLSHNKFYHFAPFATVIENSIAPIRYLNINGCDISPKDTKALFEALIDFKYAHKLQFLLIGGAQFNDRAISSFEYFLSLSNLTYLDLSCIQDVVNVLVALKHQTPPKLNTLILRNSLCNTDARKALKKIVKRSKTLHTLDVSSTGMNLESLFRLIKTIHCNRHLDQFTLKLDDLGLKGSNLKQFIKFIQDPEDSDRSEKDSRRKKSKRMSLPKWKSLSFASNEMTLGDLNALLKLLSMMPNLEYINLDDNFDSAMIGIGKPLTDLLKLPAIKGISLKGSDRHVLEDELYQFIDEASNVFGLEALDISHNLITDKSIKVLKKLLTTTETLKSLKLDDSGFMSYKTIETLVDSIYKCPSLIDFDFPITDSSNIYFNERDDRILVILNMLQTNANLIINSHIRNQSKGKSTRHSSKKHSSVLRFKLPFEVENKEVQSLVANLIEKYSVIPESKTNIHSLACQVFNLPLPFQGLNDYPEESGLEIQKLEHSSKLKVYDEENSLRCYVEEPKKHYDKANWDHVTYLPTCGPTVYRAIDGDYLSMLEPSNHALTHLPRKKPDNSQRRVQLPNNSGDVLSTDQSGTVGLKSLNVDVDALDDLIDTGLVNYKLITSDDEADQLEPRQSTKKRRRFYESRQYDKGNDRTKGIQPSDSDSDVILEPPAPQKRRPLDTSSDDDKPILQKRAQRINIGFSSSDSSPKKRDRIDDDSDDIKPRKGSGRIKASSSDDGSNVFRQVPASRVAPKPSSSYRIKTSPDSDDEPVRSPRSRSRIQYRTSDSSSLSDESERANQSHDKRPQANGPDMYKLSQLSRPPHLANPQSVMDYAYDLMIADDNQPKKSRIPQSSQRKSGF